jgi:Carboxypeptidase regulatory-like domain
MCEARHFFLIPMRAIMAKRSPKDGIKRPGLSQERLLVLFLTLAIVCIGAVNSSRAHTQTIQLVDLKVQKIGAIVQIEIVANGPVDNAALEQIVRVDEAVVRIHGARSALEPAYEVNDQLVSAIRVISTGNAADPSVEIVISTGKGGAVGSQARPGGFLIEVSASSFFRRSASDREKATVAKTRDSNGAIGKSPDGGGKRKSKSTKDGLKETSSTNNGVPNTSSQASAGSTSSSNNQDGGSARESTIKTVAVKDDSKRRSAPISTSKDLSVPTAKNLPASASSPVAAFASAGAQQTMGALRGTVTDEAGALIVGASIKLDDHQGHTYNAQTDNQGQYRVTPVVAGAYELTASAAGFAPYTQKELQISSGSPTKLDITLKVVITAQVDVRAGPISDLSGTILTGSDIDALPKDPTQLLRKLHQMAAMMGIPDAAIYVDGAGGERLPSKEDIQMIKISPHSFAAQYAQPTAGRIEVSSKPSGHFHGDFSFKFNDEALNARDPFAPNRAPLQIREYDGYISGPITPGRWGFSAYIGRYDHDENSVVNAVTLNPSTLAAQSFATTVLTPNRQTYFSLGTSYLMKRKHTLRIKYSGSDSRDLNQGVGGFDLPERAYNSSSRYAKVTFSLTSLFAENRINELRFQASRTRSATGALSSLPAIFVLESFNAGGNQGSLFTSDRTDEIAFGDDFTYSRKNHLFKAGVGMESARLRDIDRANFGGTFTFGSDVERDSAGNPILDGNGLPIAITSLEHYRRTVLGLPGYRPSQFSIVRGNPLVGLSQSEMAWFAQDDWKISSRMVFSYGLRHTFQTNVRNKWNFAPRLGFAWLPGKKRTDTIRAGVGFFYSNVGSEITFDTIRLDGQHQQEITVQQPTFFPNVPDALAGAAAQPTIRTKDPNLRAPYSMISMVTYKPQLPFGLSGTVSYTWQRGMHLLRSRNINAPIPGTSGRRPFMNSGPILQFESTGRLYSHTLGMSLSKDITSSLSLSGVYTFSSSRSDTDGPYAVPANPYNLLTEIGPTSGVSRHHFRVEAWSSLPWGLKLSPYASLSSGAPFNITTGLDNNGDTLFADRPAFGQLRGPGVIVTRFGIFNPNPRPGDILVPRNFGRGPRTLSSGLNLYKSFSFGSGGDESVGSVFNRARRSVRGPYSLSFSADVENFLNHTNFGEFNGVLTSPFFGRANSSEGPRKVKVGLELSF